MHTAEGGDGVEGNGKGDISRGQAHFEVLLVTAVLNPPPSLQAAMQHCLSR